MIPRTQQNVEEPTWQEILQTSVRSGADLQKRLDLPPELFSVEGEKQFAVRIPEPYLRRIQPGNPNDPLLLQVMPGAGEALSPTGFSPDPVQEHDASPVPGIVHKYHGRVLLILTGGCAINCRYCFRRHFPYGDHRLSRAQWQQSLDYIRERESISEVILSGGDPLLVDDASFAWLTEAIDQIAHVKRLRIHTRLPVVIPQRITPQWLNLLDPLRLHTVTVLHINHPNEIDAAVMKMVGVIRERGHTLLNQSVLLKNINDSADTLVQLSEQLFACGILPYYLHTLDRVTGAAHFEVDQQRTADIGRELLKRLPGYLVPRLVSEIGGKQSKTPFNPPPAENDPLAKMAGSTIREK